MNEEYYSLNNKNLAITVSYLLNEKFYTFDDRRIGMEGKKFYSFKNTKKLKEILTLVRKYHKNN